MSESSRTVVIYIFGKNPFTFRGGGSNYLLSHAKATSLYGFEPHIFCLNHKEYDEDIGYVKIHNIKFAYFTNIISKLSTNYFYKGSILGYFSSLPHRDICSGLVSKPLVRAILKFLESLTSETKVVIHGFSTWGMIGVEVKRIMNTRNIEIPVVSSFYTSLSHEFDGKWNSFMNPISIGGFIKYSIEKLIIEMSSSKLEEETLSFSDKLICNYRSVEKLIQDEYSSKILFELMDYCPLTSFDPVQTQHSIIDSESTNTYVHIVSLSRHDPRKGLDVLIKAIEYLALDDLKFRVTIGSGGYLFDYHQKMVKEKGLCRFIQFSGWLEDSTNFLNSGDIFVLPSLEEGSGSLSLIEAMRAKLAVVATNIDGIPEVVKNNENGLLVEPNNSRDLAEALKSLILNYSLRNRIASSAHKTYNEKYSTISFSSSLGKLYSNILNNSNQTIR